MACDPVGVKDIAERTGYSVVAVKKWLSRGKGGVAFPDPNGAVSGMSWWNWPRVLAWLKRTGADDRM